MEEQRSDVGFRLEQESTGGGLRGEALVLEVFFGLRILGQSLTMYCI